MIYFKIEKIEDLNINIFSLELNASFNKQALENLPHHLISNSLFPKVLEAESSPTVFVLACWIA